MIEKYLLTKDMPNIIYVCDPIVIRIECRIHVISNSASTYQHARNSLILTIEGGILKESSNLKIYIEPSAVKRWKFDPSAFIKQI
jgi:hypothetical protein